MHMALGANIKRFRENRKWDQATLSEKAQVAIGTISALEVRDSDRSKYTAQIAAGLGVTMEQLNSGVDPLETKAEGKTAKTAKTPQPEPLSDAALELARMWQRLPVFKQRGYLEAIMVDAAVLDVFPELQDVMRAVSNATSLKYHLAMSGFKVARKKIEGQMDLDL